MQQKLLNEGSIDSAIIIDYLINNPNDANQIRAFWGKNPGTFSFEGKEFSYASELRSIEIAIHTFEGKLHRKWNYSMAVLLLDSKSKIRLLLTERKTNNNKIFSFHRIRSNFKFDSHKNFDNL